MWPEDLRADLRQGIKARNAGDLEMSVRYLSRSPLHRLLAPSAHLITLVGRALQTAHNTTLEPHSFLKVSGIASLLSSVHEAAHHTQAAYDVLVQTMQPRDAPLTTPERLRVVAVAMKLAELAEEMKLQEKEEEWLVRAVEEVVRVLKLAPDSGNAESNIEPEQRSLLLVELELPLWVRSTDLGAPLEALGAFYARIGKSE
jgi:hypothetical protein